VWAIILKYTIKLKFYTALAEKGKNQFGEACRTLEVKENTVEQTAMSEDEDDYMSDKFLSG